MEPSCLFVLITSLFCRLFSYPLDTGTQCLHKSINSMKFPKEIYFFVSEKYVDIRSNMEPKFVHWIIKDHFMSPQIITKTFSLCTFKLTFWLCFRRFHTHDNPYIRMTSHWIGEAVEAGGGHVIFVRPFPDFITRTRQKHFIFVRFDVECQQVSISSSHITNIT